MRSRGVTSEVTGIDPAATSRGTHHPRSERSGQQSSCPDDSGKNAPAEVAA